MERGVARSRAISIVIGLVVPWALAFQFFKTPSYQHRRFIITLFITIFGSVMLLGTGDGFVHQSAVESVYSKMTTEQFVTDLWKIVTFQLTATGSKDLYIHFISYFFGGVLGLPKLFFPFVAAVYGYFFSGVILHVLRNFDLSRTNYLIVCFVGVFLTVKGLEGFYTVRTWTGLWILVYSCLKYHETRKSRYLVLMFVPPLVHIAYFVLAIPAWIVLVLGNRPAIYVGLFMASSVTTLLPVEQSADFLSRTERGSLQVQGYRVDESKVALEEFEQLQGSTNWYNAYRRAGIQRWAPTVLIFTLVFSGFYPGLMNQEARKIFSIGLLTMTLSNSTWFLYALHNRSLTVAMVFLLAAFVMARSGSRFSERRRRIPTYYKWGLHVSLALFIPLIMFNVSLVLNRTSIFVFGLPFIAWLDPGANVSLKEILNDLLGR